jgi:hypothetical protein
MLERVGAENPVTLTCAFSGSSVTSPDGRTIERLSFTASQLAQHGVNHGPRGVLFHSHGRRALTKRRPIERCKRVEGS